MAKKQPLKGSLADQLKQAGLLSEKKAQKIEREKKKDERRERKQQKVDRDAPIGAQKVKQAAEQARAERAEVDRERARGQQTEAERARWAELVAKHAETGSGNRRFYFVQRDGAIPFVEPPDVAMKALGRGEAAIVETHGALRGGASVAIVSGRQVVEELWRIDADSVRYWNGVTPPRRLPRGVEPPAVAKKPDAPAEES